MAKSRTEKFKVVHDSYKHEVLVNVEGKNDITLLDLANAIQKQCEVPINKQKLICKGRSLFPQVAGTLEELGVSAKDKILLIGKRANEEEMKQVKIIEKVDSNVEELRNKFIEKETELIGIEQGFLGANQAKDSLQKLSKHIAGISEGLMKQLESLDDLIFEQNFTDAREKRKALTLKVQNYLKENDTAEERITEITSKR